MFESEVNFYLEWNQGLFERGKGIVREWQIIAVGICVLFPPPEWIASRCSLLVRNRKERMCHFCELANCFVCSVMHRCRPGSQVCSMLLKKACDSLITLNCELVCECVCAQCPAMNCRPTWDIFLLSVPSLRSVFLGLAPDPAQFQENLVNKIFLR